jgi:hypothetical protein
VEPGGQVLKRGLLEKMWRRRLALAEANGCVAACNAAPNTGMLDRELEDFGVEEDISKAEVN